MSKISELTDGGSLLPTDYLIAVRSGGNVKVQADDITVDQVNLGDNEFIRLGNSQDLTLVHNASNSIINQAGIGDLLIQKAGSTKLTVNSTGIDVTGTVTATGTASLNSSNSAGTALQVGGESGGGIKTRYVFSGASQHNWQLGFATHLSQTFSITPSSAVGNTTFTTPVLNINGSTGAAAFNAGVVINESGADADFRVESDTKTHAFFVDGDGASNRLKIGMGTGTITNPYSQNNFTDLNIDGVWGGVISFKLGGTEYGWIGQRSSGNGDMIVGASSGQSLFLASNGNISRIELTDAGNVVVNPTGADNDFRVESDTETNAFTVDGETGQVGVGSRSGFRFGYGSLYGNAGSSGSGYPAIGYNIKFTGTGDDYGTWVTDTSWRLDIGQTNRLQVYSRSSSAPVASGASFTAGPYVDLNGTSWTSPSDARLKENVNTITGAIDKVKAMRPVNYTWIHDGEGASNQVGFIAQEMALVVPEVVDIPEDDEVHLGIQYEKLVPVLTAALQEALTKIETLEARITALES